jgi:hypothetical protein
MANIRINGNTYRQLAENLWKDPFNSKQYNRAVMDILKRFPNGYPSNFVSIFNPLFDNRKNDLIRKYYVLFYLSPVVGDVDPTNYDGWGDATKRAFVGTPSLNYGDVRQYNGTRAYPFSFDPVDLNSTPWHNIIYEYVHQSYISGWRSFHFHFPFGNFNYSWLLDPVLKPSTYTSTTNPEQSPARFKGFSQAIKSLLDGTLAPGLTRPAMTEYCDVHLYLTGGGGWLNYKVKANEYWDSLAGTTAEKDGVYLQKLDELVGYYTSMKSDKGILSLTLDVGCLTATPSDIELFRTLNPTQAWGYRSDVVELTNWYFTQKMKENGIAVNCESRPFIETNKAIITGDTGSIEGPIGQTCSSDWTNFTSDSSWFWYSDPERAISRIIKM